MSKIEEKVAESKAKRPVNVFTFPKDAGWRYKTAGLVELSSAEELQAVKRSGGQAGALAYELAKAALAEMDGLPVSLGDGSTDLAWEKLGQQGRNLILQAYSEISAPADGVAEAFLASRQVKV